MSRAEGVSRPFPAVLADEIRTGKLASTDALVLVFVLSSSLTAAAGLTGRSSGYDVLAGTLTSVLATGIVVLALVFLRALVGIAPWLYSLPSMVALAISFGVLRLEMLAWMHEVLSIPTIFSATVRPLAGALQGLGWLMFGSVYFANRDRFAEARSKVLDDQARIELMAHHQSALSNALARELAEAVEARVSASVSKSREGIALALDVEDSAQALRRMAGTLRATIDDDIRPMSRELWMEAPSEQMRIGLRSMLRLGCYSTPYPIAATVTAAVMFVTPMALSMHSPIWALLMLLAQIAMIALVLEGADRFVRRHDAEDGAGFWSGIVAASIITVIPPGTMTSFGWSTQDVAYWAIFCSLAVAGVMFLTSLTFGLAGSRSSVLQRAGASLSAIDVSQRMRARELAEASRLLARHLHSSLQGRLMAIALELERAADEHNRAIALEAMRRLDVLLDTPMLGALDVQRVDVEQALTALAAEWSAITFVELQVHLVTPASLHRGDLVVGIVEEALANAIRHGHAMHVRIEVTQQGSDVVVRVENDGDAIVEGAAGLGSKWLDSVSPSNWTLTARPDGGGAILEVRLPGVAAGAVA